MVLEVVQEVHHRGTRFEVAGSTEAGFRHRWGTSNVCISSSNFLTAPGVTLQVTQQVLLISHVKSMLLRAIREMACSDGM